MLISVIVPVYNSERYLEKCVNSILQQSYKEIELILINDGSTDKSAQICDAICCEDNRVILINQKNSGTSVARNTGLKNATGDYVTFVDNDDYWMNKDAISDIVTQLEQSKADALMFNTMSINEKSGEKRIGGDKLCRQEVVKQAPEKALKEILEKGVMHRAVWAKVVRRQLILDNDIWFPEGKRNEDTAWTAKLFLVARSYDWYEKVFYVYRKATGESQTSMPMNQKQLDDLQNILCEYIERATSLRNPYMKKAYLSYLMMPYSVWLGYMTASLWKKDTSKSLVQNKIRQMKKYAFVLNANYDKGMKKVSMLYKVCRYYLTAVALGVWVTFNR